MIRTGGSTLAGAEPDPGSSRLPGRRLAITANLLATSAGTGARGLAVEAACLMTHLALYPTGVLRGRRDTDLDGGYALQRLAPLERGLWVHAPDAATTPVLLVHGLIDNRSVFARLRRHLCRRGFRRVVPVQLPLRTASVEDGARVLARMVARIAGDDGHVNVIAHSLGGLIARYYVQRMGGDRQVDTLITLASPHGGTRLAELVPRPLPYPLLRQLRPDSSLIAELAEPAPGCRTRIIAVAAALDTVVRPAQATVHHPDLDVVNLTVPGLGHQSLAFSGAVAHQVTTWLAESAPDAPAPTAR
ncbi:triacylglycerol lipase [Frankia sp. AiPs1]|uniref:esterase/lipase family protein n=1 Tax=Frankia sp. AiPa1 TaxID=573492 RepID=UPI00202B2D50|nr:alpha/beta hydrolase [Frankia sp. AiPa1]MCL9757752.1 alpha/beta hydrolase [Frankia sp. AiPa1]